MTAEAIELIDRLRKHNDDRLYLEADELMSEAADTIERLERELADSDHNFKVTLKAFADSQKQNVLLREALKRVHAFDRCSRLIQEEALAATADLEGLVLCEKEPVALVPIGAGVRPSIRSTCGINCVSEKVAKEYADESILKLYRAREQK